MMKTNSRPGELHKPAAAKEERHDQGVRGSDLGAVDHAIAEPSQHTNEARVMWAHPVAVPGKQHVCHGLFVCTALFAVQTRCAPVIPDGEGRAFSSAQPAVPPRDNPTK